MAVQHGMPGEWAKVRGTVWSLWPLGVCLVCLGIIFFILRYPIAYGFSDDAGVIDITAKLFCFGIAYQVFDALGVTISGALRGAGDTRFPMVIQFVGIWLVMVPLIYYFGNTMGWGVYGAWAASSVTIVVTGIFYFVRFKQGRWKTMGVSEKC